MLNVIKHIICELTGYRPGTVDVSQGDRQSRAVSCRLLENNTPWMIPEGATARVAYTLPDGTEGLYDSRADGTPMWEIAGNIVTVELADQLMAQAGMAQVSILVIGSDGGQLAAWPIRVNVVANKAARLPVPERLPPFGAGFAGKIFFGGADGTVTPLAVGDGVEIVRLEDGTYALNAAGGLGEESDPTVPDWAKEPQKPSYTAEEVGALPAGTKIPGKTSELTNDSGFVSNAVSDLINYYTKAQMQELIAAIPRFRVTVVQQLPSAGEELVLYLVPFATAEGQYLEYIWVDGRWEVIGSQQVDLSGYATEMWVKEYVAENAAQGITWGTLEGKPTYVQTGPRVVEWNGAMDGDRFEIDEPDTTVTTWLKVSDEIPGKEELIGAEFDTNSDRLWLGPISAIEDGVGCYGSNDHGILVVTQAGEIENPYGRDGVAPSTGIYVPLWAYKEQASPYLRLSYGEYSQEKFDPAWLPDGGFGWEGPGGKTDILPETELVMDESTQTMPMPDGRTLYGYLFHPMALALVDGEEYQITIDGVAHRRNCVLSDHYDNPIYYLGNLSLPGVGEDTGEDWVFFTQQAEPGYWVGMFATTNTAYKTVAVSTEGMVVHQILDKFIPASIARKTDIPNGGENVDLTGYATEEWVLSELVKRGHLKPEFANSIEECTDTSKLYVLPDGYIYAYMDVVEHVPNYTNLAQNFESGRLSSEGIVEADGVTVCTDYIGKLANGDVVRVKGFGTLRNYFCTWYKTPPTPWSNERLQVDGNTHYSYAYDSGRDIVTITRIDDYAGYSYIRVSGILTGTREDVVITINEDIMESEFTPIITREWANTGHAFVPADYEDRIIALEEKVGAMGVTSGGYAVPSYWESAVAEKTAAVRALQEQGGKNCVCFAWAGDTHIPDNSGGRTTDLGKVMAAMLDNCNIPFAAIAGDVNTQASFDTEDKLIESMESIPEHLAPLWGSERLLVALGNHDGCYGDSSGYYRKQFTPERMWNIFFRWQALDSRRVFSEDGLYFYVDNATQKTRFIVLNGYFGGEYAVDENGWGVNNRFGVSCYGQAQLDWLADVALDMPEGYGAVIITHSPVEYAQDEALIVGILDAYNSRTEFSGSFTAGVDGWSNSSVSVDFTTAKGEIIAVFAGHIHEDTIDTNTMSCPIITIVSAGGSNTNGPIRSPGTDTETSFDVVTFNRATRTIFCTRVGAGSDRQVAY